MGNFTQNLLILMSLVSRLMLLPSLIAGFWVYLCSILYFVRFSRYVRYLDVECGYLPASSKDFKQKIFFSSLVQFSQNFNDVVVGVSHSSISI